MESVKIVLMEHSQMLQLGPASLVLRPAPTASAVLTVQDVISGTIFMRINAYRMFQYAK